MSWSCVQPTKCQLKPATRRTISPPTRAVGQGKCGENQLTERGSASLSVAFGTIDVHWKHCLPGTSGSSMHKYNPDVNKNSRPPLFHHLVSCHTDLNTNDPNFGLRYLTLPSAQFQGRPRSSRTSLKVADFQVQSIVHIVLV